MKYSKFENSIKEKFNQEEEELEYKPTPTDLILSFLSSLIWFTLTYYALYLSLKCNKGIDILSLLFAFCCSPIYIISIFALHYEQCFEAVKEIVPTP